MPQFAVRALDANGDYSFGQSAANFLVDSPAAVAQCVLTRLRLWQGEWFLDLTAGTPWMQQIMGKSRPAGRDAAIRQVILLTPFVKGISNYATTVDLRTRAWTMSCDLDTAFGTISIVVPFTATPNAGAFQLNYSPAGGTQGAG
jgi:hypothetical protein